MKVLEPMDDTEGKGVAHGDRIKELRERTDHTQPSHPPSRTLHSIVATSGRLPVTINTTPREQIPAATKKGAWGASCRRRPPMRLAGMTTRPRVK